MTVISDDIFQFWEDFTMEDIEEELVSELEESDNGKIQKLLFAGQRINYNKVEATQDEVGRMRRALWAASLTGLGVIFTVAVAV